MVHYIDRSDTDARCNVNIIIQNEMKWENVDENLRNERRSLNANHFIWYIKPVGHLASGIWWKGLDLSLLIFFSSSSSYSIFHSISLSRWRCKTIGQWHDMILGHTHLYSQSTNKQLLAAMSNVFNCFWLCKMHSKSITRSI